MGYPSEAKRIGKSTSVVQLTFALFLTELVRSAFLLSFLPAYAAEQQMTIAAVGVAISVHYLADTVIKLVAGYALDRFPLRLILNVFLLLGLLGLFLSYGIIAPWAIIVGAALLGIGISPIWLLCLSLIREDQRGSQMGSVYTVWLAALGLGPVAVNFLIDRSYAMTFWLLAGIWIAGWALAAAKRIPFVQGSLSAAAVPLKQQMRDLRRKLSRMKPLVPGMIVQTLAAGLLVPVLPSFASRYLTLDYSSYSLVLMGGGLMTVLLLIPMGRLADKRGHQGLLIVGFAALAVSLGLLIYSRQFFSTFLLAACLGTAYAAVLPAWNALMSYFVPADQKATGWGVLSGIEGIGVILGPIAGGWMAERFDETVTVAVSALLLLAIALFYWIHPVRRYAPAYGDGRDEVEGGSIQHR
ncbi:MFS transporter [Cohnella nanjingensis]|uniref:MFS transporter n=1 Tax=Cohnella nanjingensis TaxID=1387779 RepID=A0A7X0RT09_9BACL|nr:MFS transporter [Cohnella nanjingensis]MBB6673040.1 MFS transporter [Cohnella nanjingensis]